MTARYPTHEQKHGMYVQLLRDKSEEYLRNAFHKTFPRNPTKLYIELKKHDPKLKNLLKKGTLNQKQYDTIFPQSKETNSSKFDATLMFTLLRYLCGYQAPATGWNNEPNQNDRSESANLVRLKLGRNRIQHSSLSITNAEYKDLYLYIRQPLIDLGCPLNDICHARSFKYDNQPAIESFIGREDEMNQIHQLINNNRPIYGVVIAGIPGVGKTELARKYCQQHEQEFEHIIWVNCNSIENSFQNIAQTLKLDCRQGQGFKDLKVIAQLISEYFKNEKLLFVFDNCINGSEDLIDVLSLRHLNIITSKIKFWGQDYKVIVLDVWSEKVAFDFLIKIMKQSEDFYDDYKQLTLKLSYHPLALQHAVAYIKESELTVNDYLEILSEHKLDVLSERVALRHGLKTSVFSSFQITIERIKKDYPQVFEFLSIFSVLEINFMKEEFLERYFATRLDYLKAIKVLINFNLIKKSVKILESKKKLIYYTMHSLYQCSIETYQTDNNKNIVRNIFGKIIIGRQSCFHIENQPKFDVLKEAYVWSHQFHYIWCNKSQLRKLLLQEIANNYIHVMDCLGKALNYRRQIIEELYQEFKNKTNNVNWYLIKLDKLVGDTDMVMMDNALKNLKLEVEQNLPSASVEKTNVIKRINTMLLFDDDCNEIRLLIEGYFHEMLTVYKTYTQSYPDFQAVCLKELKRYDEALEIMFQYEEVNNVHINAKLEIGCCYILQGKIEEGLRVVENIDDEIIHRIPLQVGRALFDVGCYEQSTEYLNDFVVKYRYYKKFEFYICHFLDALSKLFVQNCVIEDFDIEPLLKRHLSLNDRMIIRLELLLCCFIIRQFDYTKAFHLAECILQEQRQKQCSSIWFREGLFIAKNLRRRHEYYQALLIYQIIERFQNELDIPKQTLDGEEIDVKQCINICLNSWRKIFRV